MNTKKKPFALALTLLVVAAAFVFAAPARARAGALEDNILKSMMMFCITPVVTNTDIAAQAAQMKLDEFPPAQAKLFDKTGGRVFAVPGAEGNAVLVARSQLPGCSMPIRKVDAAAFWKAVQVFLGPRDGLPFKLVESKKLPDGAQYTALTADFRGPTAMLITMSPHPKEGGMQGIMTFSRVKDVPKK